MNAFAMGALIARERLRGVTPALTLGLGCCAVYLIGLLERRRDLASATDTTLSGAVFGITLPLFAYFACERVCNGERLTRSVDAVARHGGDRRAAVLGLLATLAACMALVAALLTCAALLGSRTSLADWGMSIGIALVAGAAYASCFGVASLVGMRGGGRRWALALDLLFGAGSSSWAAPWPRAHIRNLLGGEPALDLTQAGAWFALAMIGVLGLTLCALRTPE
jgi:hypothetical protein